jgi:hypothetical protein
MPLMDDMELVDTVNSVVKNPENLFSILTRQQNDHRSLIPRLVALFVYLLDGYINFKLIVILGFLNLVLLTLSLSLILRSAKANVLLHIFLFFFIFTPFVFPVHLWSLTAYQSTLSVSFSFISLYFLQPRKSKIWYCSIPFAVLSSFTFLDGISIFPVALLWLFLQRRWKELIIYSGVILFYFYLYFSNFKLSSASDILPANELIRAASLNLITFTGSIAKILSDTHVFKLSFTFGCIFLLIFIVNCYQRIKFENSVGFKFKFSGIGFAEIAFIRLQASAFMISIGRSAEGVDTMAAYRYNIFSVTIAVLICIILIRMVSEKYQYAVSIGVLGSGILMCFYTYLKYDRQIKLMVSELKADSHNYRHHSVYLHQYFNMPDPKPEFYRYHKFPVYYPEEVIDSWSLLISKSDEDNNLKLRAVVPESSAVYKNHIYPVVELYVSNVPGHLPGNGLHLGLLHASKPHVFYLVAMKDLSNNGLKKFVSTDDTGNFAAAVPEKLIPGIYKAGLVWMDDGVPKVVKIDDDFQAFAK